MSKHPLGRPGARIFDGKTAVNDRRANAIRVRSRYGVEHEPRDAGRHNIVERSLKRNRAETEPPVNTRQTARTTVSRDRDLLHNSRSGVDAPYYTPRPRRQAVWSER